MALPLACLGLRAGAADGGPVTALFAVERSA
jgi:hypothetical protein